MYYDLEIRSWVKWRVVGGGIFETQLSDEELVRFRFGVWVEWLVEESLVFRGIVFRGFEVGKFVCCVLGIKGRLEELKCYVEGGEQQEVGLEGYISRMGSLYLNVSVKCMFWGDFFGCCVENRFGGDQVGDYSSDVVGGDGLNQGVLGVKVKGSRSCLDLFWKQKEGKSQGCFVVF